MPIRESDQALALPPKGNFRLVAEVGGKAPVSWQFAELNGPLDATRFQGYSSEQVNEYLASGNFKQRKPRFKQRWAPGTMQRRAYALALYSGMRKKDQLTRTRNDRQDGGIWVVQSKTGKILWILEHRELTAELAVVSPPSTPLLVISHRRRASHSMRPITALGSPRRSRRQRYRLIAFAQPAQMRGAQAGRARV
jgi:hypothetical protein